MRKIWLLVLAVAVLLGITSGSGACLNAQDVLVVYNTRPSIIPVSRAVADYYACSRSIPQGNVCGINTITAEAISHTEYLLTIASPLWTNYLSKPEYSHIKCIVLCYGIPSRIIYQPNYDMSVDSALTLLGNPGVPNAQGEFAKQKCD